MNSFFNKKLSKLIIIPTLFIIIFNCIFPTYSTAYDGIGGTLFEAMKDFICGIGDVVLNLLQDTFMPQAPKAVDKRSISALMAEAAWENAKKEGGILNYISAAFFSLDEAVSNHTFFVGKGLTYIQNKAENGWESIKSLFTGNDPEYNKVEKYYDETVIPIILYSPATIFYNKVPALDVNFINPSVSYAGGSVDISLGANGIEADYEEKEESTDEKTKFEGNTAYQLRDTIASWYKSLRDVAIVALLSVLVYVAIRIILSSTAGETAKYKEMLKDWVLALCLLFVMHYMMAFLLNICESVTEIINTKGVLTDETNQDEFMQNIRFAAGEAANDEGDSDLGDQFGYTLIYIILVFYTAIFTWKYLIRLIYLAFLTMIAPLVAVTYPIDKISDGKAQAFTVWFREYVFNVLLQPMHMILYTILITSVSDFAEKNMVYAVVAIGFLLQAEKLIKSMFGFNKAEGGGLSAAITGGALFGAMSSGVKSAVNFLPGSRGNSGGSGSSGTSSSSSANSGKVHYSRQADKNTPKGLSAFTNSTNSDNSSITAKANANKLSSGRNKTMKNPTNVKKLGSIGARANMKKGATNKNFSGGTNRKLTLGNVAKGAGSLGLKGAKGAGRLGLKGLKVGGRTIRGAATMSGRLVGKAIRPALTIAGGLTGATIGLAAGLASDDYSNIAKFGAAGAGVGALAGGKAADVTKYAMTELPGKGANFVRDTVDDFQRGYYGKDEYAEKLQEKENKRADKEWKKDEEVLRRFQREYGAQYKEKMDEALELRKAGITDQDEIERAIDLMEKNKGLTTEQAANIMQFSKGLDKKDLLNNEIRENLRQKAKGMTGSDKQADKVMDLVEQKIGLK